MLNHTYTSVKNANLVDCGKKQHIPSQPLPLLRENFLGEYRTELDKKKVLSNLGIATELSLEWEFIKGDIGRSTALMAELDSRTKYISKIDGFQKTLIEGIQYLENIIGGDQESEKEQNTRISNLETQCQNINTELETLKEYLRDDIEINISNITTQLETITEKVNNITNLIQVSGKANNAIVLLLEDSDQLQEGETPGLYVPDLSTELSTATSNIEKLQTDINSINESLDDFVTKEELGGDDFNFVKQEEYDSYVEESETRFVNIESELDKTVKTGEDGHVDTLYVNTISKNNNDDSIKITDSFEVTSGVPLDIRFVVKNLEQLHSLKPLVCYPGMGVIVQDQASLYILRDPIDGIIDEDYIKDKNGTNWKCPEDLIIEVLTQEEYDKKVEEDSINPNMFYYIHEEVVEEPVRQDYDTDEAYTEALNKWLRVLQQKYMSAVWGQEIESLVSSKASNTAVKSLETQIIDLKILIDSLSGGSSGINLKILNEQVNENTSNINSLNQISQNIQESLEQFQTNVSENYVTTESITTENPETNYIFVKKSEFQTYTDQHASEIAEQITTNNIITENVKFGDNSLNTNETDLMFNNQKIALLNEVPNIELVDYTDFDPESDLDDQTYYYVYNATERYITGTEFDSYKEVQSGNLSTISDNINKNSQSIGDLISLSTSNKNNLVIAINELVSKIDTLTQQLNEVQERLNNLGGV